MAEADWTFLSDGLNAATVDRGVTAGPAKPSGGGNFIYGFNSLATTPGAVGLFTNQVNFAPMAEGGSVRGVLKRAPSGGDTGFTPLLFIGLQGPSVNDSGYLLGIADSEPAHLVLKKGQVVGGVPDLAPDAPNNGILLRSTATFAKDTYVHVRLDMIVNGTGDVVLKVFRNDLGTNPIGGAFSWVAEPGMEQFIDDALQVATGSAPFTSGRGGFAFQSADVTRRGYFDHLEVFRQL